MPRRPAFSVAVFSFPLLLAGCLSSSDAIDEARDRPPSFPPISESDFTETSTGDNSNTDGLALNEVRITVQVPAAVAGSGAVEARRNLFVVEPESVRVIRTGPGLQEVAQIEVTQRRDEEGSVILKLDNFDRIPSAPDYIVIAELPGDLRISGPLADSDQDIKLNPFSEYLVSDVLNGLDEDAIEAVKACEGLCLNQLVWPTVVDQIQDFEIIIPDGLDFGEAVEYVGDRADVTGYVSSMVSVMQLPDSNVSEVEEVGASFNTVYFGLELNRRFLGDSGTVGQWGVRRMATRENTGNGGQSETYPNLTLTSFSVFDINVTSTANDIPYTRSTLTQKDPASYEGDSWKNSHASLGDVAFIRSGRFLQGGRTIYQTVTREKGFIWGWAPNPYFFDSVIVGGDDGNPDALLGSYFHSGKALALENTGTASDPDYQRRRTLEDLAVGALELNFQQQEDKTAPYNLSQLSGDYNAVSFAVVLDDESANPVSALARASHWTPNPGAEFEETDWAGWILNRVDNGTVDGPTTSLAAAQTIRVENKADEIYDIAAQETRTAYYGRLTFDGVRNSGIGAAPMGADWFAYAFSGDDGQGIKIVAREPGAGVDVVGTYKVQGISLGMTDGENRLEQFSGSFLTIDSSGASLTADRIQVLHDISADQVSDPTRVQDSYTGTIGGAGGDVILSLQNAADVSDTLELRGFAAEGGDVLVLAARGTDSVGLLLAFKL